MSHFLWIADCSRWCRYQVARYISAGLTAHWAEQLTLFGGKRKFQRTLQCIDQWFQDTRKKCYTFKRREAVRKNGMDPKLAQPPELAVCLSVFRSTHIPSSHLFYPQSMWELTLLCLCSPQKTGMVLTDVMEAWVLCKTETQVFYPHTQRENRPLSWPARSSAGDSSCKNIWLSWSPAHCLSLLSISLQWRLSHSSTCTLLVLSQLPLYCGWRATLKIN